MAEEEDLIFTEEENLLLDEMIAGLKKINEKMEKSMKRDQIHFDRLEQGLANIVKSMESVNKKMDQLCSTTSASGSNSNLEVAPIIKFNRTPFQAEKQRDAICIDLANNNSEETENLPLIVLSMDHHSKQVTLIVKNETIAEDDLLRRTTENHVILEQGCNIRPTLGFFLQKSDVMKMILDKKGATTKGSNPDSFNILDNVKVAQEIRAPGPTRIVTFWPFRNGLYEQFSRYPFQISDALSLSLGVVTEWVNQNDPVLVLFFNNTFNALKEK